MIRDKEFYEDEGFLGYLQDLIEMKRLDGMEAGIAKLVLDKGIEALSSKQLYIFETAINEFILDSCPRCGGDIPWSEMLDAIDNDGLCGYCLHVWERLQNE